MYPKIPEYVQGEAGDAYGAAMQKVADRLHDRGITLDWSSGKPMSGSVDMTVNFLYPFEINAERVLTGKSA